MVPKGKRRILARVSRWWRVNFDLIWEFVIVGFQEIAAIILRILKVSRKGSRILDLMIYGFIAQIGNYPGVGIISTGYCFMKRRRWLQNFHQQFLTTNLLSYGLTNFNILGVLKIHIRFNGVIWSILWWPRSKLLRPLFNNLQI